MSAVRMTSRSPCSRTTKPATVFPSVVSIIVTSYWSEMAFDGQRMDSTMSFFWKRLFKVERSGPMSVPIEPNRWQAAHTFS